jgi:hypothetical protein
MFEPTAALQTALGYGTPIFVLGDTGGTNGTLDPNWGGCNVWLSLDGVNYEQVGTLSGPSVMGTTTSGLSAYFGPNPDTSDSLSVYLGMSGGTLANSGDAAAAAGQSLCIIVDNSGYEVFTYTTALLSTPFEFTLTGLYRGLYGTAPRTFAPGSQFMFIGLNANMVIDNLPLSYVGQNFFVKAQSYNTFGHVTQDLSDCVVYEYFVGGSGAGGMLLVTDAAIASDIFGFPWQTNGARADAAATTDVFVGVVSRLVMLSDSLMASDVMTIPPSAMYSRGLSDSVASSDTSVITSANQAADWADMAITSDVMTP